MAESKPAAGAVPAANPLDDINVQAPGRLLTVEVLVSLLARDHPKREAIFAEAATMLSRIEGEYQAELEEAGRERLQQMFIISRAWLAKLDAESAAAEGP